MLSHLLALSELLVTDACALLVTNETTEGHTLEGFVWEITVNIARRDETRQGRFAYAKKVQRDMIPLALGRTDVEQKLPECIGHFDNLLAGARATKKILFSFLMMGGEKR